MVGLPENHNSHSSHIVRFIAGMPSLPVTVTRVLEICNSPATSPDDLNRVIALDPVLTGRVLKLVNSAYYGLCNTITSLPRAIIMLGMNTIKNLVIGSAIVNSFGRISFHALSMTNFWLHCLCVGVTAKRLAILKEVPITQREDYFVGGLLHDLGKIPLISLFSHEYLQILSSGSRCVLYNSERKILGLDHMQVGKMIGEKWKLGIAISDCLHHHHDPDNAAEENRQKVKIIELADMFSKYLGIGNAGDLPPDGDTLNHNMSANGFTGAQLEGLKETVEEEIEKARIFLQSTTRG
ncbi:MAG: HDOD domain-containing protein [Syntrophales bacterium]|jgi:HD-like signal output (HDOD) protein|nr:HDOD domain-containing protein [Syntrophales bacterium]MDY0044707.1 HDOD domain-containing protein [Syntrophales bacterium]